MEIIKLFPIFFCMYQTFFDWQLLFNKRKPFEIFGQFKGLLIETNEENLRFFLREKGTKKDTNG